MSSTLLEHSPAPSARIADQKFTILLVGAVENSRRGARSIFSQFSWSTERANNFGEASRLIRRDLHRVIVSEKDLPDENWKDVLEAAAAREDPPLIIVTSRSADEYLWAEVLNLGGYDVLAQPFDRNEVHRSVSLAFQHWQSRHEMATRFRRDKRGNQRERNRRETRAIG